LSMELKGLTERKGTVMHSQESEHITTLRWLGSRQLAECYALLTRSETIVHIWNRCLKTNQGFVHSSVWTAYFAKASFVNQKILPLNISVSRSHFGLHLRHSCYINISPRWCCTQWFFLCTMKTR
jgi:hypothetical protein